MAEKTLNTIIVLRNDKSTDWANSEVILKEGELGVSYLDNGNVMVKAGDGVNKFSDLKQVESVLTEDITLTYNFGRHKTSNGSVDAGGKDMTMTQWIVDALSEVLNPKTNYPGATLACGTITTDTGDKEIGSKITKFAWNGTSTYGSYKDVDNSGTYGTVEATTSSDTGLAAKNFTWSITNSLDAQTGNTEDGTFTLVSDNYKQINSESSTTYAYLNGKATIDASGARTPLNNVGKAYEAGKITGFDKAGTTEKEFKNVAVSCAGFRKPFWAVLTTPFAETKNDEGAVTAIALTSDDVRGFTGKGTKVNGFPTTLAVAEGSRQVIFCAKAGTYKSVVAKDGNAQDATVTFSKIANAVNVEGANDFTATAYDVFEVTWGDPIASAKALKLTWS